MKKVNYAELAAGILCLLYYFVCIIAVGSGISILYIWLVAGLFLVVKAVTGLFLWKKPMDNGNRMKHIKVAKVVRGIYIVIDVIIAVMLVSVLFFTCFVIRGMYEKAENGCDYVIVLGARVNGTEPSEILQKRINAAYSYLRENPNTKVIGTGGVSAGGRVSEGKCIAEKLEEMGIAPSRILYEEQSMTTVENMKFALGKVGGKPKRIAVVSNGFHISRAKFILSGFTDAEVCGIAAAGGGIVIPHYIVREYIAFVIDMVLGNYSTL